MKRLILLVALPAIAGTPTWEVGNRLAVEYRAWTALRNPRVADPITVNNIDYQEVQQWQRVKSAWRALERQVDMEYRGERR